jgi:hypothetical protein
MWGGMQIVDKRIFQPKTRLVISEVLTEILDFEVLALNAFMDLK